MCVVLGVPIVFAAGQWISSLLFGVKAADPPSVIWSLSRLAQTFIKIEWLSSRHDIAPRAVEEDPPIIFGLHKSSAGLS